MSECQYCKHWHRVPDDRRSLTTKRKSVRKCGETGEQVKSETDASECEFFELHKSFYCDTFRGWVPVLGCINRQIKSICNCTQGELVCDLTAGIDPIDLGGKPRPVIIKRKKPADVVTLNRKRPKLIKRKKAS
jgi:hypothetical protein